jgi:23S rRNA (adenine2503-C2)-methyltransferase
VELPISTSRPQTLSLLGVYPDELREMLVADGHPAYRAAQILEWIYSRNASAFDAMTNLPVNLREQLARRFHLYESTIAAEADATDGTRKLLLRWADGATSECVLIPDGQRRTACISTQVGCPVGCVFCASGLDGVERNLTAGQIVEQAMRVRDLCAGGPRLSNVVFMGLGEPLANYDATIRAVRMINHLSGLGIAARRITVSTVGLPKQMRRLADEDLQITLALSLHAPDDELRSRLIPWAEGVSIEQLIDAGRYYFEKTGREVTLEYVLLGDLNDTPECARRLVKVCSRLRCNVNLIRYNPVEGLPYERPAADRAQQFLDLLRAGGVNAHVRRSRGLDIDSACGQLRRRTTAQI